MGEHPVEGGGELRVPIPDQERDRLRTLTDFHDQVPGHLGRPQKILPALAATRDGLGNPPATP